MTLGVDRSFAASRSAALPGISALCVALIEEPPIGVHLTSVDTGAKAIELLRILRFDLVLLSASVPDMSPWQLAAQIRRFWPWQRWALVAPEAADADIRRAGELGAVAVLDHVSDHLASMRQSQAHTEHCNPLNSTNRNRRKLHESQLPLA
jgi:CheY-like chemotaxis protein